MMRQQYRGKRLAAAAVAAVGILTLSRVGSASEPLLVLIETAAKDALGCMAMRRTPSVLARTCSDRGCAIQSRTATAHDGAEY